MQPELEQEEGIHHLHTAHPKLAELWRFLGSEATRDEVRAIVRPLLTGCPECGAVMRQLLRFEKEGGLASGTTGGYQVMEIDAGMSIGAIVAQAQLRFVVAVLKMVRNFLQSIVTALPLSAQERDPQADLGAKPDVTAEIRRVGEVVIADCLDPAITHLSGAAEYRV